MTFHPLNKCKVKHSFYHRLQKQGMLEDPLFDSSTNFFQTYVTNTDKEFAGQKDDVPVTQLK